MKEDTENKNIETKEEEMTLPKFFGITQERFKELEQGVIEVMGVSKDPKDFSNEELTVLIEKINSDVKVIELFLSLAKTDNEKAAMTYMAGNLMHYMQKFINSIVDRLAIRRMMETNPELAMIAQLFAG